jgi:CDP-glucose 4,6-dehydratase
MRAFASGRPVVIRRPAAVRPWQHVLEPLSGYLSLAEHLSNDPRRFGEAWNFGPPTDEAQPVAWVVDRLSRFWGDGARWEPDPGTHPHEAGLLQVDASKARARLGWTPRLPLEESLRWTVDWYRRVRAGEDAAALTLEQIERFVGLGQGL